MWVVSLRPANHSLKAVLLPYGVRELKLIMLYFTAQRLYKLKRTSLIPFRDTKKGTENSISAGVSFLLIKAKYMASVFLLAHPAIENTFLRKHLSNIK